VEIGIIASDIIFMIVPVKGVMVKEIGHSV